MSSCCVDNHSHPLYDVLASVEKLKSLLAMESHLDEEMDELERVYQLDQLKCDWLIAEGYSDLCDVIKEQMLKTESLLQMYRPMLEDTCAEKVSHIRHIMAMQSQRQLEAQCTQHRQQPQQHQQQPQQRQENHQGQRQSSCQAWMCGCNPPQTHQPRLRYSQLEERVKEDEELDKEQSDSICRHVYRDSVRRLSLDEKYLMSVEQSQDRARRAVNGGNRQHNLKRRRRNRVKKSKLSLHLTKTDSNNASRNFDNPNVNSINANVNSPIWAKKQRKSGKTHVCVTTSSSKKLQQRKERFQLTLTNGTDVCPTYTTGKGMCHMCCNARLMQRCLFPNTNIDTHHRKRMVNIISIRNVTNERKQNVNNMIGFRNVANECKNRQKTLNNFGHFLNNSLCRCTSQQQEQEIATQNQSSIKDARSRKKSDHRFISCNRTDLYCHSLSGKQDNEIKCQTTMRHTGNQWHVNSANSFAMPGVNISEEQDSHSTPVDNVISSAPFSPVENDLFSRLSSPSDNDLLSVPSLVENSLSSMSPSSEDDYFLFPPKSEFMALMNSGRE